MESERKASEATELLKESLKLFRSEQSDKDIINRVKYDINYIENWSILLDIKIIFMTLYNAVRGEEKAY